MLFFLNWWGARLGWMLGPVSPQPTAPPVITAFAISKIALTLSLAALTLRRGILLVPKRF
ncbi:unnamed protein product [Linum tenue]|uniref:Uncharacterized protein n=1 Tax=Linum tenue TaxID=586396 RepID=A0AAV0RNN7_9ROSI|nr:unnamed protein product [Linum tenue]